ncbi:hypothetical protein R1T40_04455 [Tritonibacter scottomollicae]|uniref:Transposase n=1 Tax=Tritonibacter scottomollicae TaxID=483013 RepID=A0ABZ0HJ17_TRISK|nr:hypothetical protein [Tritonibacter scottomollicae]WOI33999.1 hypothetical protein R1T40_04455 [Tritonibacter scottomollicae]
MKRYVGIDVAQKEFALCIVDDAGSSQGFVSAGKPGAVELAQSQCSKPS